MLENSFIHLPGIGPETEERLWRNGLKSWDDLASNLGDLFTAKKAGQIAAAIEDSRAAHEACEYNYFQGRLKGSEMWRLLPALFKQKMSDQIAYLDIETTGLGFPPLSHSTTIAVLYEGRLHVVHDHQKKHELLREIDAKAKMLVTFNGGPFDLPFLRKEFGLPFSQAHLDLRFWFAKLNIRGGLKKIQQSFAQIPQREFIDIDGYDAVRLWAMHERGVERALETLMTYNAEDTVVLEQLVFCGLNIESEKRPHLMLPTYAHPASRVIPTRVCPHVYRLLRG